MLHHGSIIMRLGTSQATNFTDWSLCQNNLVKSSSFWCLFLTSLSSPAKAPRSQVAWRRWEPKAHVIPPSDTIIGEISRCNLGNTRRRVSSPSSFSSDRQTWASRRGGVRPRRLPGSAAAAGPTPPLPGDATAPPSATSSWNSWRWPSDRTSTPTSTTGRSWPGSPSSTRPASRWFMKCEICWFEIFRLYFTHLFLFMT